MARAHMAPRPTGRVGPLLLAAALMVAAWVGARGITDEGTLTGNDAPRYAMDGVFLLDALTSGVTWTPRGIVGYAEPYFARYPALSLGLHPPLWPATLVPFYAALGVSAFAARMAALSCFLVAVVLLYTLARRVYDDQVAGWAALFFGSHPFMAYFAQRVLSETLAILLVLAALNALVRFCDLGKLRDYGLFILAAVAACAARQNAILLGPAYLAVLLTRGGWPRVARRDVIMVTALGAALLTPIGVITLLYARFNITMVGNVWRDGLTGWRPEVMAVVGRAQWLPALGIAGAAGMMNAAFRSDGRILVAVYWMASVLLGVLFVTGPMEPDRYSVLALPASCICAASVIVISRSRPLRAILTTMLLLGVACQVWWARDMRPPRANGYEEAARFVLADAPDAPTVLYSASVDTGAFVFFVRKHDPAQRLVVLRADKILTTSQMSQLNVEDRIRKPEDIYPLLDRYGTKLVVIEDRPSGSVVLDWLLQELKSDRFVERRRIDAKTGGQPLVIYEYTSAHTPDPDAVVDMKIPLIGREIRVRLADLQPRAARQRTPSVDR